MKLLIIQTAFIGDVILATPVVEQLSALYPHATIDFLLRKGNESLLHNNPHIRKILIWDKKENKYRNLFKLLKVIRDEHYDVVINLQRFTASGLLTSLSGAPVRIGFDKNPFSFAYTQKVKHEINNGKHEVERNIQTVEQLSVVSDQLKKDTPSAVNYSLSTYPKLYPAEQDYNIVQSYKTTLYICIAPTSIWFTKQYPAEKWLELIYKLKDTYTIYLLGAHSDHVACEAIRTKAHSERVLNLCGKLSFLQSAALMRDAVMNYVNDSAPMHIASTMNAPVTVVFCSTIPAFGFGPLSNNAHIVEIKEALYCRPCGLHGYNTCPQGHFKCAKNIEVADLLSVLE